MFSCVDTTDVYRLSSADGHSGAPLERSDVLIQSHIGAATVLLLVSMVLVRVRLLRQRGVSAMQFGKTDKSDFLIPPFAFLYFYVIFAGTFGWPTFAHEGLVQSPIVQSIGVLLCAGGLLMMLLSLVSFGTSFRVGIDSEHPDKLITTGIFAYTRNPIYVAFGFVLLGEFFIQPHIILLIYLIAGVALFHRQVLREEAFLRRHYSEEYVAYAKRVRRYL